jgi:hypothetical protein
MKIISKYKDYYDYLSSIWGIDEKLVLDRRETENYCLIDNTIFRLYIAGYIIEGLMKDDKFYYGNNLRQFTEKEYRYKYLRGFDNKRDYKKSISIKINGNLYYIYFEIVKDKENINEKNNCPILINLGNKFKKYPKLDNFKLGSFIPPENIYKWISAWLSNQITKKENTNRELDNNLKIINKGFDIKRSFRPKIRKQ